MTKLATRELPIAVAAASWGAVVGLFVFFLSAGQSDRLSVTDESGQPWPVPDGRVWLWATVAMVLVVALMAAAIVIGVAVRRTRVRLRTYVSGVALSAGLWVFGGLACFVMATWNGDCGGAGDSPCLDHPGATLYVIASVSFAIPTVVLYATCWLAWLSRTWALVAPALIASTYLLTVHLLLPHVGFGDVTTCRLPYDCYHLNAQGLPVSDAVGGFDLSPLIEPLFLLGLVALVVTAGVTVGRILTSADARAWLRRWTR
jgi:hypothetical protein